MLPGSDVDDVGPVYRVHTPWPSPSPCRDSVHSPWPKGPGGGDKDGT